MSVSPKQALVGLWQNQASAPGYLVRLAIALRQPIPPGIFVNVGSVGHITSLTDRIKGQSALALSIRHHA